VTNGGLMRTTVDSGTLLHPLRAASRHGGERLVGRHRARQAGRRTGHREARRALRDQRAAGGRNCSTPPASRLTAHRCISNIRMSLSLAFDAQCRRLGDGRQHRRQSRWNGTLPCRRKEIASGGAKIPCLLDTGNLLQTIAPQP
jgi:hypothetical protein